MFCPTCLNETFIFDFGIGEFYCNLNCAFIGLKKRYYEQLMFIQNNDFVEKIYLDYDLIDKKYEPIYQTHGAACADILIKGNHELKDKEVKKIPTGFIIKRMPLNHKLEILTRGSTFFNGLEILHGTIDMDFIGEVFIGVRNVSGKKIELKDCDRIAQICMTKVTKIPRLVFNTKERTSEGCGSTGYNDINIVNYMNDNIISDMNNIDLENFDVNDIDSFVNVNNECNQ
jgi:dUTPase